MSLPLAKILQIVLQFWNKIENIQQMFTCINILLIHERGFFSSHLCNISDIQYIHISEWLFIYMIYN